MYNELYLLPFCSGETARRAPGTPERVSQEKEKVMEKYESLEMEIILFDAQDVIATSCPRELDDVVPPEVPLN